MTRGTNACVESSRIANLPSGKSLSGDFVRNLMRLDLIGPIAASNSGVL
jgi:hypothetical protein